MERYKFRAWDIDSNRWVNQFELANIFYEIMVNKNQDVTEMFVIEQYTGLKDKNGKDIYGGDRLKRRIMDNSMDWIDMTCEVRWMKWCYGLYIHDKYITVLDTATANSCEVVGHIHEQLNKG